MVRKSSKRLTNVRRTRKSGRKSKSEGDDSTKGWKLQYHVARNLPLYALPKPLHSGSIARYRMLASTFGVQTGLSNVGGASSPGQLIQNSATPLAAVIGAQLSDFAGYSSFAAIFDQYRIKEILVRIKARSNAVSVFNTASPNGSVPTAYIVRDLDDATALGAVSDALQYDNCQTFNGEEDCVVRYTPAVTPAVYGGGAFSGYAVEQASKMWLDIANVTIPHYGLKLVVGGLTASTTSSWAWDITAEAIIEFQNTR